MASHPCSASPRAETSSSLGWGTQWYGPGGVFSLPFTYGGIGIWRWRDGQPSHGEEPYSGRQGGSGAPPGPGRAAPVGRAAAGRGDTLPPEEGDVGASAGGGRWAGPGRSRGSGKGDGCGRRRGRQQLDVPLAVPWEGESRLELGWAAAPSHGQGRTPLGSPQARVPRTPSSAVTRWASPGPATRLVDPSVSQARKRELRSLFPWCRTDRRGQGNAVRVRQGSGGPSFGERSLPHEPLGSRPLGAPQLQVSEAGGRPAQHCPACGSISSDFSRTRAAVAGFYASPTPSCLLCTGS